MAAPGQRRLIYVSVYILMAMGMSLGENKGRYSWFHNSYITGFCLKNNSEFYWWIIDSSIIACLIYLDWLIFHAELFDSFTNHKRVRLIKKIWDLLNSGMLFFNEFDVIFLPYPFSYASVYFDFKFNWGTWGRVIRIKLLRFPNVFS